MRHRTVLLCIGILTLLLCTPSLLHIPRVVPFLDPEIRSAAPRALDALWQSGIWIYNTELLGAHKEEDNICFSWHHEYRARNYHLQPEILTTCIPRNPSPSS